MADNGLTREQQEQLDFIVTIEPPEVLAKMSTHQLKTYKDLLKTRDELEANFLRENEQMKAYAQPKADEPAPAPAPEPQPVEEPIAQAQPEVEPAPPVEPDIPDTKVDPAEVEAWKKRYKDLQSNISPIQQKAATMRKELDKRDDVIGELKAQVDELKTLILETRNQATAPAQPAFIDPAAGLDETDPDLANRFRAVLELARQPNKEVEELKARLDEIRQRDAMSEFNAFKSEHDGIVLGFHSDLPTILGNAEANAEFQQWLAMQKPYIQNVMLNPYAHTPYDVADVVEQFKRSKRSVGPAKKPSLGDLAANAKLTPVTPLMEQPTSQPGMLSDDEVKNIYRLVEEEAKKGRNGNPDALLARYEATMAHRAQLANTRR